MILKNLTTMMELQQSHLLGAVIGDIVGSRFELNGGRKTTDFDLITSDCTFTDDTILTCAIADAVMNKKDYAGTIRTWARRYPDAGYGKTFEKWVKNPNMGPYNSWGNGSAMRVSACGYLPTMEDVLKEAKVSAECTHNHPEGIKGAQATAGLYFSRTRGRIEKVH